MANDIVARYTLRFNDLASKGLLRTAGAARAMTKALAVGAAASALLAAAAGGAAIKLANSYAARVDDIAKFSKETGFAADAMQRLDHVAGIQGASIEGVRKGIVKFNKNLGELRGGTGELYTKMKFLNPELQKQLLSVKDSEQAYWALVKAVAATEGAENKMALAAAAVGAKGARGILLMASDGVEGIQTLMDEAGKLRPPLGPNALAAAEAYNDAILRVKTALFSVGDSAGGKTLPVITKLADRMTKFIISNREMINLQVGQFFEKFAAAVAKIEFDKVLKAVTGIGSAIIAFGTMMANAAEIVGGAENLIMITVGAFAAFNLVGFLAGINSVIPILPMLVGGIKLVGLAALSTAKALIPLVVSLGWPLIAIGALIAGAVALYHNWDTVKAFAKSLGLDLDKVWSSIKSGFNTLVSASKTAWKAITFAIVNPVGAMKAILIAHIDFIAGFFGTSFKGIARQSAAIWSSIKSGVSGFVSGMSDSVISRITALKSVWSSVMNGIAGIASSVWSGIKSVFASGVNFLIDKINWLLESYNAVASKVGAAQVGLVAPVGNSQPVFSLANGLDGIGAAGNRATNAKASVLRKETSNTVTLRTESGTQVSSVTGDDAAYSRDGDNFSFGK